MVFVSGWNIIFMGAYLVWAASVWAISELLWVANNECNFPRVQHSSATFRVSETQESISSLLLSKLLHIPHSPAEYIYWHNQCHLEQNVSGAESPAGSRQHPVFLLVSTLLPCHLLKVTRELLDKKTIYVHSVCKFGILSMERSRGMETFKSNCCLLLQDLDMSCSVC